jgi:hypothetical protein
MAENSKSTAQADKLNGLFVRGMVMPSTAKVFNRKGGSGKLVCVQHKIALQPSPAVWEECYDPNDGKVKLDGDKVVEFPKQAEIQQITLKVLRFEEGDTRLVVKDAQIVG